MARGERRPKLMSLKAGIKRTRKFVGDIEEYFLHLLQ